MEDSPAQTVPPPLTAPVSVPQVTATPYAVGVVLRKWSQPRLSDQAQPLSFFVRPSYVTPPKDGSIRIHPAFSDQA